MAMLLAAPCASGTLAPTLRVVMLSAARFLRVLRALTRLSLLLVVVVAVHAQDSNQKETTTGGGVSTGAAHAAVKDAQARPITAGGFVENAPVVFEDITKQAGLDKFHHRSGTTKKESIIETPGSGVALLDYDNDGWLDIYLVNGSTISAFKGSEPPPRAMLFHNNHDGTFTDVTEKAGVGNERWGFGVVVGDYDNDGWADIYVANFGSNRLYHNNHDGTFTDVAVKAGVTLGDWSTGPTWGDYDHDGKLDLFVPGYVKFDADHPPIAGQGTIPANFCQFRGVAVMCGPRGLPGEHDHLFHNNGDGTFTDVTFSSGLGINNRYVAWGCGFIDYDNDGWPDIIQINGHVYPEIDQHDIGQTFKNPRLVYKNLGDGRFKDVSAEMGPGITEHFSSRGAAFGDYDNDGDIDILVLNLSDPPSLLRNDGGNSKNWIKIKLVGTQCNRTAIGARVRVVTGKHAQMDEVHSGSSVMSQCDLRLHFGLGQAAVADVIEVKWPTTQKVERFTQVKANQILTIREGSGIVDTFKPKAK
jgi:hypothetical protein